ncbi:MAG: Glutathione S-transferase? [uncultured Sphingomonadaceae bacterium]|uniref:Glutathione S-transferase n=1 Tax=uncultured Sphingomonadaceae bacterium TaxID=169976 RepID=A0A6J4S4Y8_9SPHN|nr:MAG: Glutathione S-transferase? [uncultured Sphingomonadaceae bacterium]
MIVYGASISPFVRKVLVFAAEKGIAVESKMVGLQSHDPEFRAASPFGKIPALRDGDYTLADSSAIVQYLEALHPEPALIPTDPRARGEAIWWDEFADTILVGTGGPIFAERVVKPLFLRQPNDPARADALERDELPAVLDHLEREIGDRAFLVENRFTLADIAVASPFANFAHAKVRRELDRHPRLHAYVDRILARPSFAGLIEREAKMISRVA